MTDYSKLSDREIDHLVLNIVYGVHVNDKDIHRCWSRGSFKYTTNASEAWPIITENKISLVRCSDKWLAVPFDSCIDGQTSEPSETMWADRAVVLENPLRAAMIVFLMMQENK